MRTANPALSDKVFQNVNLTSADRMTVSGAVQKSFFLVGLVVLSSAWSWQNALSGSWSATEIPSIPSWYFLVVIANFILGLVIIFKKDKAPYLAPVYALAQGLTLGTLSVLFESRYPGIVFQAVTGTFGTFVALLLAYQSGLIKATENFKLGVVAATGGIALVYLVDLGLRFFGHSVPLLHESTPLGIGISVFIVIVAALNLVLDFDFIENGAQRGAPKFMEWYAAFGLLVTLIWLYVEILRLLAKSRKR